MANEGWMFLNFKNGCKSDGRESKTYTAVALDVSNEDEITSASVAERAQTLLCILREFG